MSDNKKRGKKERSSSENRGNNRGNRGHRGRGRGGRNNVTRGGLDGNRQTTSRPSTPLEMYRLDQRAQSVDRLQDQPFNMPNRQNYGGHYTPNPNPRNDRQPNMSLHRGGHQNRHNKANLGFQRLENLSNLEPDQLIVTLSNENSGLEKLFGSKMSNDYIVLILRVLNQMFKSTFQENKASVLATVCGRNFMDQLTIYLCGIYVHDPQDKVRNKYFWEAQERFWDDLLNFFEQILQIIPNTAREILPKLLKQTCISVSNMEIYQKISIPDSIKEKLNNLQTKIRIMQEIEQKKLIELALEDEIEPPNDFRNISLYPTVLEVTTPEKAFVRANIITGNYRSVDHYLDVQFRLLREDFVAPLREGICDYLTQQISRVYKKISNVRLYKDVYFSKKITIQDKVSLVVQIPTQKRKFTLENSKRFMFGSLICFTNNNFQSVIFGTVASRDEDLIKKRQIAVDTLANVEINKPYIMAECSVYFEPYYHVLKALQMMNEQNFPMKRYIIDVAADVNAPAYLTSSSVYDHEHFTFIPLNPESWPTNHQLGLDPSQFKAFKAALTKEFCVIQGPPGTGKTFIGLKVAQVLLENSKIWNDSRCPILVICYTNHALDQFLEGIQKFTTKIIRVGGRSKSQIMKSYNIREMRMKTARNRDSSQLLFKKREEIRDCMIKINSHQTLLEAIIACDRIINFKHFEVLDPQLRHSWFSRAKPTEIVGWLMGGKNEEERYEERTQNRIAQIQAEIIKENNDEEKSDSDEEFFDAEAQEEREVDDRDEIIIKTDHLNFSSMILITQKKYEEKIRNLEKDLATIEAKVEEQNAYLLYDEKGMKERELFKVKDELEYFKWRMNQFKTNRSPRRPAGVNYQNPELLSPGERWGLYCHWLNLFRQQLWGDLSILDGNYRRTYRQYEEVRQIEDIRVMREMLVIGMTTTGAARYQTLLQALKCPIVIVEEAAEVLESHVVVSLTSHCKQVILIGDHQQLRPSTADFVLAKDFKLDISLFERMVKNGLHCEQLEVQHRMRPEIARLIVPAIYLKLENHRSVETYPPIHGISKNLFFISHSEPEEILDDTKTKRNVHEAHFILKLARHLILQGYEPSEITILTTYSGQRFYFWKERKQYRKLEDVRISVVDDFQGEENKIILLSLVRSNNEDDVGFLKISNRICVALSRAKEGMYIIGNMNNLEKHSLWTKIKTVLEENGQIGSHLTLQCQVHPEQLTPVSKAEDFKVVIEGGCSLMCQKPLDCGHVCASMCHVTDREHSGYKCMERCNKILCEVDHQCPDFCSEICKPCRVPMPVILKCGHTHQLPCHIHDTSKHLCTTKVNVELECGHKTKKPCHRDIATFPCPHTCEIRKLCGHACDRKCHVKDDPDHLMMRCFKPCAKVKKNCSLNIHMCPLQCYEDCQLCEVKVKKMRSCQHLYDIACSVDVEEMECKRRCKKKMECGHDCRQDCCEPCGKCSVKVDKIIPECGHTVKMRCDEIPVRAKCRGKCPRFLQCGHPCDKRCNEPCQDMCKIFVDNPRPSACGHKFQIPCYKSELALEPSSLKLLKHCNAPCEQTLLCTHRCMGTCGACLQGRLHATCNKTCGKTLICGHPCEIPCSETCQPCPKKCFYRCEHSRCGKKCGEPCTTCKEKCTRRCPHSVCTNICGEICSVPPCTEPCPELLRCGHPCIGFCGDNCPPVCRECNKDDETFSFCLLGNEEDPDSRFVYLPECKHTIEAEGLEYWLQQKSDGEIGVKMCPKCKTVIFPQRFSEYVKEAYKDVNKVKEKWFGNEMENEEIRRQLQYQVEELRKDSDLFKDLNVTLNKIKKGLEETHKGKRNPLNIISVGACRTQLELISRVTKIFKKSLMENRDKFSINIKHFNFLIKLIVDKDGRISRQKISDLQFEINRFERLMQLTKIEGNSRFKIAVTNDKTKELYTKIHAEIHSITQFSDSKDQTIKLELEELRIAVDKSMHITEEERKMIVNAMQLGSGRWFKCPNGHYYAIGECGGAMEVSECNECGAQIGGRNHTLLSSNRFAGEIDGARHPAWGNAANMDMRNFQI